MGECAGGHRAENRRKSRDIMMQPREWSICTHLNNKIEHPNISDPCRKDSQYFDVSNCSTSNRYYVIYSILSIPISFLSMLLLVLFQAERARPYLMTHDSNDSTDYINACYVDGSKPPIPGNRPNLCYDSMLRWHTI